MKALILAGLAVATLTVGSLGTAQASGGCGPFAHRGYYGACRPHGGYGYGYHRPFYGHGYEDAYSRPFYGTAAATDGVATSTEVNGRG